MDDEIKGKVPGFNEPKQGGFIVSKETGISVALVIAIAGGVYNFAFQQGKNEARDRDLIEVRNELKSLREDVRKQEINQIKLCSAIPNCRMNK